MDESNNPVRKQPSSAPSVPKELLSARPAMTKVVPRYPDKVEHTGNAIAPPEATLEELADRKERLDYLKGLRGADPKPEKSKKKWLIGLLVLILLAAASGGAYWFMNKPADNKNGTSANTTQASGQPSTDIATKPSDMKSYESTNLPVAFKYPSDWTVSDTATKLTLTSTATSFKDASGKQANGEIIITIRPKQATLDEFKTGNATAVLDSKHLSYSQPAAGQRDSTYVSYLQYANTTAKGALDGLYITGNAGYQKGQFVPMADVIKVDPLITVSFVSCTGATCTSAVSIDASAWTASKYGSIVETILQSLALS